MKTLFTTTTDVLFRMNLTHCGDYAGKFIHEAYDLMREVTDIPVFEENQWADIMYDREGNVYAVWAEDSLTCFNADAMYIQLDRGDCEEAFKGMEEKTT